MATTLQEAEFSMTQLAASDLSAKQYYLVKEDAAADRQVVLAAANTDVVLGILTNKPAAAGRAATVQYGGIGKVIYGATVTRGDALMSDTGGKAITATGSNPVFADALESGAANEIHSVSLR